MKNRILIIAGSDPSGGAGIQADIKTATKLKTYCASVISCLTAQNSQEVCEVFYLPSDFIFKQIEAVLSDIKIDFIKIGMIGNYETAKSVSEALKKNANGASIITDPVMIATSGDSLLNKDALDILKTGLIANSYLTTPNIFEAEILSEMTIINLKNIKVAAKKIQKIGSKNVLIKGGHLNFGDKIINYLLKENGEEKLFYSKKLPFSNVHGTGCTLATAITSLLSHNLGLEMAIKKSNQFVYRAIKKSQTIGKNPNIGSRFLQHY